MVTPTSSPFSGSPDDLSIKVGKICSVELADGLWGDVPVYRRLHRCLQRYALVLQSGTGAPRPGHSADGIRRSTRHGLRVYARARSEQRQLMHAGHLIRLASLVFHSVISIRRRTRAASPRGSPWPTESV